MTDDIRIIRNAILDALDWADMIPERIGKRLRNALAALDRIEKEGK